MIIAETEINNCHRGIEQFVIKKESPQLPFPTSIDINPTAKCNLACRFCWGPEHSIPDSLGTQDWKDVISCFAENGTNSIVFTGGEPLIRQDIGELLKYAKEAGMRTTLSTNTLLLKRKAESVLPFVDEIGVPIDGSTTENNAKMREGNKRAFDSSLEALKLIADGYPQIHVTVRTVVSKVNTNDLLNVGSLLQEKNSQINRWKLYEFAPVSIGSLHKEEFEIGTEEFQKIVSTVLETFPTLPITAYPSKDRTGRYVFIGPEGNIFGVNLAGEYVTVGNIKQIRKGNINSLMQGLFSPKENVNHAHENLHF